MTSHSKWSVLESPSSFGLCRVVLASTLLQDILHLYFHRAIFLVEWNRTLPLRPALLVWSVVLVFFLVGYHTRIASIANFVCASLILGRSSVINQIAGDSIAISLSLLAVFLPFGSALSVDCWRNRSVGRVFALHRWLLAMYLSAVYVDSGMRKLASPMWCSGLGLSLPASLPSKVWFNMTFLEWFPDPLLQTLGRSVIAFELLFPILYLFRNTRTAILVMGIILHLGIALVYPFPVFSALMIAAYIPLLPSKWFTAIERFDEWMKSRTTLTESSPHASFLPRRLYSVFAGAFAALWLFLSALSLTADLTHYSSARNLWYRIRGKVFTLTGIFTHGVFDDFLFYNYRYQIRLTSSAQYSGNSSMPYGKNGLFVFSVRDRVWEHWWKRTQSPWTKIPEAETRLKCWAEFWWPGTTQSIEIEARPQKVNLKSVERDLFRKNNAIAWRKIGRIEVRNGKPSVLVWNEVPNDKEKWLGQFLIRLMAHQQSKPGILLPNSPQRR